MAERVFSERYRVMRHLARGGMAEVYLAHDQLLDRPVAVKVLFPELANDDSFVERFRREARAAAGLNHHNIVSVFDFGTDDGSYFIVMEYVDGPTLRDIIRSEGPLEPTRAATIAAEIAAALHVARHHGVIHRDVKPGNVLISGGSVKVADFGIARAGDPRESLTMTGAVMGTATYLSPEQAQGKAIDHRSDLYSLGIVLYEMLAGRSPFSGDSPIAIAYQHLNETPLPPSTHNSAVPPALDAIALRALDKDPDARYSSADELRSALLAVCHGAEDAEATVVAAPAAATEGVTSTAVLPPPTAAATAVGPPAGPPTTVGAPPPSVYRRRRLVVLAMVVLLVVGIGALIALLSGGDDTAEATVPSVVGLSVDDARARLDGAGLQSTVEERDDLDAPSDKVAEQRPPAGEEVARTTTVTLVVPAPTTTIPPTTSAPRTTTATTRPAPTTTLAPATTAPPTTVPPTVTIPPITLPPSTTKTTGQSSQRSDTTR